MRLWRGNNDAGQTTFERRAHVHVPEDRGAVVQQHKGHDGTSVHGTRPRGIREKKRKEDADRTEGF